MHKTVGVFVSLMFASIVVHADEPPPQPDAAAQAKAGDEPKQQDKKTKAAIGYEDAPEAGVRRPARRNGVRDFLREPGEGDAVRLKGDFNDVLIIQVDAQVKQRERQFLPQLSPLMTAELSFINRACNLNLEQRKKIKAASDLCLKAAVRTYALAANGRAFGFQGRRVETIPDPSELMHQALANVLEETLQPQQRTAYDAEMAKRKAFRQRAAVAGLVAIIDKRLFLTAEQRQKLSESLVNNWNPNWGQSSETLINAADNLPGIPDQFVMPMLNESQQQVWRTTRKASYSSWGGIGWGNELGAVDDFPLEETVADEERSSEN